MHILYLTSSLSFGGAQKVMVCLAEQAVQRGHEATILTICPGNDFEDRLQEAGISFRTLGYEGRFTPRNVRSLLRLRRQMVEAVQQIGPDVIHEQLFIPKILASGMSGIAGYPVVHTQQDSSPWWTDDGWYSRLQTLIERLFSRRTATENVAISASVLDEMKELGLVRDGDGTVIHNFTDLDSSFERVESNSYGDDRSFSLFMVTRLAWEKKGLDTAVEVLAELRAQNEDVQFVVVGDGPDRSRMVRYAKDKGVRDCIDFRGYREDVQAQYREADLLLMPSRWEGLSVTAIEAASMGVPIVGSGIGGIQEVVEHGETGYTCPPEDVSCFVEHVKNLIHDPERRRQFSRNSVDRVQAHFTPESAFDAYEDIYRKCQDSFVQ